MVDIKCYKDGNIINIEYEYSFEVLRLDEFIDYCDNNKYDFVSKKHQVITIYRNYPNIARITISEDKNKIIKELDFKEDCISDNDLNIRRESKKIQFDDLENCENVLSFLQYRKDNTLDRERIVYQKDKVKFELDEYFLPKKKYVVSLEGKKNIVDKIYNEIK